MIPKPKWLLPVAAAGLLLMGLIVAWAVVLRAKTANGTLGLKSVPEDAAMEVNGDRIMVTPHGGEPSQDTIKNSIGMTLKLIPAGEFMMGSADDDKDASDNEKPQHRVRITRPFYLGVYEVTQAQYETVTGSNPSHFSANGGGRGKVAGQSTERHPVERVSWLEAVEFCNKLSELEGRADFYEIDGDKVQVPEWNRAGYRLPTEAEWEYACRAHCANPDALLIWV